MDARYGEGAVLVTLYLNPAGMVRHELAKRLDRDADNVGRQLRNLEGAGLVIAAEMDRPPDLRGSMPLWWTPTQQGLLQAAQLVSEQTTATAPAWVRRLHERGPGAHMGRGLEVLRLVARGYTTAKVAKELDIAENTVKEHLLRLRRRFKARNTTHLVAKVTAAGVNLLRET